MADSSLILIIFGMALVTYLPRVLPLLLLSSRKLPLFFVRWLELIPPAVLAALLAPGILLGKHGDGSLYLHLATDNLFLLAAIPAILTNLLTRSFFGTVAVGMGSVALLRAVL